MKLKSYIILAAVLTAFAAQASVKVTGTVSCGKQKISGVVVTDGRNFTVTSKSGKYTLLADDGAKMVYIVTPSGYVADYTSGTPAFYQTISDKKRYDFSLNRTASPTDDYTLFAISDPQCKTAKHFEQFAGAPFQDIKAQGEKYMQEGNVLAVLLGDIGWDSFSLINPMYKEKMKELPFPVYPVIGNHDFDRNSVDLAAQDAYERDFGPVNYAFWTGKDLVICLKNIIYSTQKKYKEGYTDAEIGFISGLLKHIPESTHIYVAQHSPTFLTVYNRFIIRGEEMISLFGERSVDILSGHTHISNFFQHTPTVAEHNPAAICGAWWDTMWDNDGTPRGYKIFRKRGEDLNWFYHSVDYADDYQAEIIYKGHSVLNPSSLIINLWGWDDRWKVEYEDDKGRRAEMKQVNELSPTFMFEIMEAYKGKSIQSYKRPRKNNHYFAVKPKKDAKRATITVTTRFGEVYTYNIKL